jgi:hypothetical protein
MQVVLSNSYPACTRYSSQYMFHDVVKVLAYYADYGIEQHGKKRQNTSFQHFRRHMRFVVNDVIKHKLVPNSASQKPSRLSASTVCVPAHRTVHFRRSFDLPRKLAPSSGFLNAKQRQQRHRGATGSSNDVTITSSCDRLLASLDIESLLISVKYFCKVKPV